MIFGKRKKKQMHRLIILRFFFDLTKLQRIWELSPSFTVMERMKTEEEERIVFASFVPHIPGSSSTLLSQS